VPTTATPAASGPTAAAAGAAPAPASGPQYFWSATLTLNECAEHAAFDIKVRKSTQDTALVYLCTGDVPPLVVKKGDVLRVRFYLENAYGITPSKFKIAEAALSWTAIEPRSAGVSANSLLVVDEGNEWQLARFDRPMASWFIVRIDEAPLRVCGAASRDRRSPSCNGASLRRGALSAAPLLLVLVLSRCCCCCCCCCCCSPGDSAFRDRLSVGRSFVFLLAISVSAVRGLASVLFSSSHARSRASESFSLSVAPVSIELDPSPL
jgi:hypothetical protein